jgi:hypothetical protein
VDQTWTKPRPLTCRPEGVHAGMLWHGGALLDS